MTALEKAQTYLVIPLIEGKIIELQKRLHAVESDAKKHIEHTFSANLRKYGEEAKYGQPNEKEHTEIIESNRKCKDGFIKEIQYLKELAFELKQQIDFED